MPVYVGLLVVLVAGALVHAPALGTRLILDDYLHSTMLHGTFAVPRHPLDLYNFVDDGDREALRARGLIPWWSHPELTIRFFRPLSSGLLWVDHALLGDGAPLRHLHSYLWWVFSVLAAAALFRRLLAPRAAWLATFAYGLAPCHAMPLAWLANREALVSLALGTTALVVYLRWRDRRRLVDAVLATVLFSFALLAGEYSLSFAGYVVAFELVQRGESAVRRVGGVSPFAVPAAAYVAVRAHLGYGSIGSGYYLDPLHAPAAFLWMAPRRFLTLLLDGWLSLDQDTLWPVSSSVMLVGALAVGAVVVAIFRMAWFDSAQRRTASWLGLGSSLAFVPFLAVVPAPRLIGVSVLGIAALAALVIDAAWFPREATGDVSAPSSAWGRRRVWLAGLVALGLAFAQLVHGPMTSLLLGRRYHIDSVGFGGQLDSLRAKMGDPASADVIVVRGSAGVFFAPFAIGTSGVSPRRFRILSLTSHVLVLRRGPRTLELIAPRGRGLFPWGETNLYLAGRVLREGEVFEAAGMRVTVLEVENELPRIARFEFEHDLDAPRVVWLNETREAYFDATPPAEGFGQPYDYNP